MSISLSIVRSDHQKGRKLVWVTNQILHLFLQARGGRQAKRDSGFNDKACLYRFPCFARIPLFLKGLGQPYPGFVLRGIEGQRLLKALYGLGTSPPNIFGSSSIDGQGWPRREILSSSAIALAFSSLTLGPNFGPANMALPNEIFLP